MKRIISILILAFALFAGKGELKAQWMGNEFGAQTFLISYEADIDYGLSYADPVELQDRLLGLGFTIISDSESMVMMEDDYGDEGEYEVMVRTVRYEKDGIIVETKSAELEGGTFSVKVTFPNKDEMDKFVATTEEVFGKPYDQSENNVYFFPIDNGLPYHRSINLDIDNLTMIVGLEGG